MTYWKETEIKPKSSPYTSTSDRLRTTIPRNLFENRFDYDTQDLLWDEPENVNGSVVHLPNESGVRLEIGQSAGDKLYRQTRQYFKYSSGKPLTVKTGIRFNSISSGRRKRSGLFTFENGLYLEQTENEIYIVRRSKASGSVQEERVPKSQWNIDKFNGYGPSEAILDLSKVQMLAVRDDWYGGGTPAVGLVIDDVLYWGHKFYTANKMALPNLGTPTLPIRHENENLSSTSEDGYLDIFGGSMIVDGDDELPGYNFSVSNQYTPVTASDASKTLILAIKPKLQFKGFDNRVQIDPKSFSLFGQTNNPVGVYYQIVRNPSFSSGLTYNDVDANFSSVEHALGNGTITGSGGELIQDDYMGIGKQDSAQINSNVNSRVPLTINANANEADVLAILAGGLGDSPNIFGSFKWKEIY